MTNYILRALKPIFIYISRRTKLCDFNKSKTFCDSFNNQKKEIQSLREIWQFIYFP